MSPDEVSNTDIDDILAAMTQDEPQKQQDKAPAADQEQQPNDPPPDADADNDSAEIGDLLLDAETTPAHDSTTEEVEPQERPDRSTLEAMLTDVDDDPVNEGPAPEEAEPEREPEPQLAQERVHEAAPQEVRAAAALQPAALPGKALWVLMALIALNGIGVIVLAAGMFSFRRNQEGNFDQLIITLRDGLQARQVAVGGPGTDDVIAQVEEATKLFDSAQYGLALPLLRKMSKALPGRPDLIWKAAMSAMHLQQWHAASEALQEFIERFPSNEAHPSALMKLGDCYARLGMHGSARKAYYSLIGFSGRLGESQKQLVPTAYTKIAGSYKLEASTIETKRAKQ